MSEIYMMVTICNRKQMQKFVKFYKQNHVDTGNISLAMGTAASDTSDSRRTRKAFIFVWSHVPPGKP